MPVPKTRCSNTMTEAAYKGYIKSLLRKGSRFWKPMMIAKRKARIGRLINTETGRMAYHATCAVCKEAVPEGNIQMDHIDPVIDPAIGFVDWNVTIERMFCEEENFQALCKPCHKIKTQAEREQAKQRKADD